MSFYEYSSNDLNSLGKIIELVKTKKIVLWLPEQVEDEFNRNRENKLSKLMTELRDKNKKSSNLQYPRICQDHTLFEEVHDLQKQYNDKFAELIKALDDDVSNATLGADKAIKGLFDSSTNKITRTKEIVDSAVRRKHIGNPPGKKGSFGDEIIWEMLLEGVPLGQKLFIVSGDGDYISSLNKNEWKSKKNAEIVLYRELSLFLKDFYPNIKLELKQEKDRLIESLTKSFGFDHTRTVIVQLLEYNDFNEEQANKLVRCCYENSQVGWILQSPEVKKFYSKLLSNHSSVLDEELKDKLETDISRINMGLRPYANDIKHH